LSRSSSCFDSQHDSQEWTDMAWDEASCSEFGRLILVITGRMIQGATGFEYLRQIQYKMDGIWSEGWVLGIALSCWLSGRLGYVIGYKIQDEISWPTRTNWWTAWKIEFNTISKPPLK
jgi:hypothetical protein